MADPPPLARRMPGFDARHATRHARRTRLVSAALVLVAVGGGAYVLFGGGPARPPTPAHHTASPGPTVSVLSTLEPFRLGAPITRAVVLPGAATAGGGLVIVGGSTTGGLAATGAFALNTASGNLTQVGDLSTTVDDAAGAVIGTQDVVFGGASSPSLSTALATVQSLPGAGAGTPASTTPATTLGSLPQTRAGATAVTVGPTTYLVGGANAAGATPDVVSTTDGQHFTTVATLAVPVAFPGVTVAHDRLYVFGGQALTGTDAGRPVDVIQTVDLKTHKATAAGRLPEALEGCAAVTLGPDIVVAGGDTTTAGAGSATTTTAGAAGPAVTTVTTIWSFDPTSGTSTDVGALPVAVSHAGLAVLGTRAWLVGGESDGTPASDVQSFVTHVVPAHHTGTGSAAR